MANISNQNQICALYIVVYYYHYHYLSYQQILAMNSIPIHITNLAQRLNVYSRQCNQITTSYRLMKQESIAEIFKSIKFVMDQQLRNPRELYENQLKHIHVQSQDSKHTQEKKQFQYTSKKNCKNSQNSSNKYPFYDTNMPNIKSNLHVNQEIVNFRSNSFLDRRLGRRVSQMKAPYQQFQKSWEQNLEQNQNIFNNQLDFVNGIQMKCERYIKQLNKNKELTEIEQKNRCNIDNDNINLMRTSRKQRNCQQINPNSQSINIKKYSTKVTPIMNAPKKQRRYRKIRRICDQVQQQTNNGQSKHSKVQSSKQSSLFGIKSSANRY